MKRSNISKLGLSAFLVASAIAVSVPARAATINLGFALDSSGSITSSGWSTITSGLSAALSAIPVGGGNTYRVSVVSFSTSGLQTNIYTGEIDTAGDLTALQTAVSGAGFLNGNTCISCGTDLLTSQFTTTWGATALTANTSIMNISTDGVPNQGETDGSILQSTLTTAGWNAVSAEAIGNFDLTYLKQLVYPGPAATTNDPNALPNPLTQGFILEVADADAYAGAIGSKVQRVVEANTPVPAALPLFASGFGGGALLLWRKKRKAKAIA